MIGEIVETFVNFYQITCATSHKAILFIATAVRTSNIILYFDYAVNNYWHPIVGINEELIVRDVEGSHFFLI
jgi:hypothetical protein